jgi:hypothetical protein
LVFKTNSDSLLETLLPVDVLDRNAECFLEGNDIIFIHYLDGALINDPLSASAHYYAYN